MPSTADSVVQWGLSQIGIQYRSGSQFVHTAYGVAGIDIPRTAVAQAFRVGNEILNPKRNLAPGDLVFPTLRIVQLYIGGGYVLRVADKGKVTRTRVRRIWRAVRITTPGGGEGQALAVPHQSPQKTIAGRRGQVLGS